MPRLTDDLGFELRQGWSAALKIVVIPVILLAFLMGAGALTIYGIQSVRAPKGPPDVMNPTAVGASTDLYADSFFASLSCMKTGEAGGCNKDDKKSKMIQSVTDQILVLNGKSYPIPEKKDLIEVMRTTELDNIDYMSLTTEQRGKNDLVLKYENRKHSMTITFSKNVEGELLVKSMEVKPKE